MTADQLRQVMPSSAGRLAKFVQPLADAMQEHGITTSKRQAAFLAQIAHESGELRYVRELASGDAYEGRLDLGNTQTGDGQRFKGRGLLQVTGRANYQSVGEALGLDLIAYPGLLEMPANACRSAGLFWARHGLNELADADKFGAITKRINGGFNGIDQRLRYWIVARKAVGL